MKILLAILVISFAAEIHAQDKWAMADKNIVRIAPNSFTQLPKSIINDLEKRHCTIPQSYIQNSKHNVISGEFKRKGQKDWAILCSKNRASSILIYWNGSSSNVSSIASSKDEGHLQTIGDDKIGFSRVIDVVGADYIIDHYKAYGGTRPPKITHNGINDAFAETASVVLYLHRGKWLELQGAD